MRQPVRVDVAPQRLPELVLVEDSKDDEELSLRGIARSGLQCHVTVRRDGQEAIEYLLGRLDPPPSVVVLDYKLPKLTGRDVLERLRGNEATRLTPVVIFSGTTVGDDLIGCYKVGANSCVVKPDDPTDYVDRLASVTRYWLAINQDSAPPLALTRRMSVD
jgi:two-component system, response regulator